LSQVAQSESAVSLSSSEEEEKEECEENNQFLLLNIGINFHIFIRNEQM
jgi:hypothetical protein